MPLKVGDGGTEELTNEEERNRMDERARGEKVKGKERAVSVAWRWMAGWWRIGERR
ncbi:unnamed protein product [Linum tenue]|uniref:Uncharacterized protein n=1 Tax=Linum tenue TaxID=586396 RepID=A0AAV0JMV9_9ROSI|nr:unnamed protein product [Linum tenue]